MAPGKSYRRIGLAARLGLCAVLLAAGIFGFTRRDSTKVATKAEVLIPASVDDSAIDEPFRPSPSPSPSPSPTLTPKKSPDPVPSFRLACEHTNLPAGERGDESVCSIASVLGFAGKVVLSCDALPPQSYCEFLNPAGDISLGKEPFLQIGAGKTGSFSFGVRAGPDTPKSTYKFLLVGVAGASKRTLTITWTVTSNPRQTLAISCPSNEYTVARGSSVSVTCRLISKSGNADVSPGCNPFYQTRCEFAPPEVRVEHLGNTEFTVTIFVDAPRPQKKTMFINGYGPDGQPIATTGFIKLNVT